MKLNRQFWINAAFSALNLFFFFLSPTEAVSMINLAAGLCCGYWAYQAATGV